MNQNQPNIAALGYNATNLLSSAVEGCALSIEVFLHRHFGARYIGFQSVLGAIFILLYSALFTDSGYDLGPLTMYFWAYLFLVAWARLDAFRRAVRGDATHSRYSGTPWLIKPGRLSELKIKQFIEPLLVFGFACLINDYNRPLSIYLMIAVCCLALSNLREAMWRRGRVMDMNDAVADQQNVAGQFRSMHGDNF